MVLRPVCLTTPERAIFAVVLPAFSGGLILAVILPGCIEGPSYCRQAASPRRGEFILAGMCKVIAGVANHMHKEDDFQNEKMRIDRLL